MKEWIVQADFPKEANMVKKKMNDRLLLLSSNITTLRFEYAPEQVVLSKKYFVLTKI